MNSRLDSRDRFPGGMEDYISLYGWHFSKKMSNWATSRMKRRNPQNGKEDNIEQMTKEQVDEFLKRHGVDTSGYIGYDHVYVIHMAKADYLKSSIVDDAHLALFVKDYMNDIDGYEEKAFTRFYSDCIGLGTPIIWEDMI